MGNYTSGLVRKYYYTLPNWKASECIDNKIIHQKQCEQSILEAVNKGELETLHRLSEENRFTFWEYLESLNSKSPLLHQAAKRGHAHIILFLFDFGMDVDECDSSGMTALHMAGQYVKQNPCIPLLLKHCRDINKRDVWGRSPLMRALVYRNFEAAELLLKKGANPNSTDYYGMTPLSIAIDYDMMEMFHSLVSCGADVNLITQHPCRFSGPPLYLAINNQNISMVRELLKLGAYTQPRLADYIGNSSQTTGPWQYLPFNSSNSSNIMPPPPANLQHNNAVSLAMSELMKRGEENMQMSSDCMEILMELLAAHGISLGPSPDVLIRVLINSRPQDFTMLLHKLQICSSCCSEEMIEMATLPIGQDSRNRPVNWLQHYQQLRQPPRRVTSLQDQARRKARQAVMASSPNVVWACDHLQCPPALKSLMLLKDIDRAFKPLVHEKGCVIA